MTACRNKARGAVVAALAGALTLGAAPVMALADGASLMESSTPSTNFAAGKVTIALGLNNAPLDLSELPEFEVGAEGNKVTPVQVTLGDGSTITSGFKVVRYSVWTDTDKDGKVDAGELGASTIDENEFPASKGTYVAVVQGTEYDNAEIYVPFKVVNKSLQGAVAYDKVTGSATLTYNGTAYAIVSGTLGIKVGDEDVAYNAQDGFSATWYDADGKIIGNGADPANAPVYAGDYTLVLDGTGAYLGSKVSVPVKIEPLDLSKAVVTLGGTGSTGTFENGAAKLPTTGGVAPTVSAISGLNALTATDFVVSGTTAVENGTYQYTVKLDEDGANYDALKGSIVNEATVSLDVVDKIADDFKYGDEDFDGDLVSEIDLSAEDHFVLDTDELVVKADGEEIDPEFVDVIVVDKETGEQGGAEMLSTPGDYYVYATVDAEACGHEFGGSSTPFLVHVKSGDIMNATLYVTYKGETDTRDVESYTGEDFLDDLTIQVKDANGNVVPATEYDIVITRDGKEEVDSIVDHGVYTVSVESDSYDVEQDTYYTFEVKSVTLKLDTVRALGTFNDEHEFLVYTGETLTPGYEWKGSDDVWRELPADVYTVTYEQDHKQVELKEPGEYTARFVISDAKGNFVATAFDKGGIKVSAKKVFADVANDQWYSEYVYTAASAEFGYMTGYGDSKFFGPADSIKRGDVAVVLYKMAGLYNEDDNGATEPGTGFDTPFSDVDSNDYWAEAIQWAAKLGIVSGDGGADTFRPGDPVTREELAKMLYRYMELQGKTGEVDVDAVLGAYEDESSVSDWARTYVAWLVEQEVMGQDSGLEGNKAISRAEVAAMTVRLQPEGRLSGDDFLR